MLVSSLVQFLGGHLCCLIVFERVAICFLDFPWEKRRSTSLHCPRLPHRRWARRCHFLIAAVAVILSIQFKSISCVFVDIKCDNPNNPLKPTTLPLLLSINYDFWDGFVQQRWKIWFSAATKYEIKTTFFMTKTNIYQYSKQEKIMLKINYIKYHPSLAYHTCDTKSCRKGFCLRDKEAFPNTPCLPDLVVWCRSG